MNVTVEGFGTEVRVTAEDIETECRPNSGADACAYLKSTVRTDGAVIHKCMYNQWQFAFGLKERLPNMTAKRMGCDRVILWHKLGMINPANVGLTFEIPVYGEPDVNGAGVPFSD